MNNIYLLPFILLYSIQNFGQTSLNWGFTIGSKKSDNISSSISDSKSNTISVLYSKDTIDVDPSANSRIFICLNRGSVLLNKYDKNGKHLWTRNFVDSNSVAIQASYTFPNNDFLITAYFTNKLYISDGGKLQLVAESPGNTLALIRMNEQGSIKWIKTYKSTEGAFFNYITDYGNNQLLLCGSYKGKLTLKDNIELPSSIREDAFIGIMDSVGNLIKYTIFSTRKSDYITNVLKKQNGEIAFGIIVDTALSINVYNAIKTYNSTNKSAYVFGSLSPNLEVQFAQVIESFDGSVEGEYTLIDEDQNYYICGYFDGTIRLDMNNTNIHTYKVLEEGDAFIVKYDKEGKILWTNIYQSRGYCGFYKLILHNNYIYSQGGFNTHIDLNPGADSLNIENPNGALLIKIDKDGKLIWHNEFFSNGNVGITNFTINSEKDITCYGFMNDRMEIDPSTKSYYLDILHPTDAFLFSLKENHLTKVVDDNTEVNLIKISQDANHIYLNSKSFIESLHIYDIHGNQIFSNNKISSTEVTIPTDSFASGIYILQTELEGVYNNDKVFINH